MNALKTFLIYLLAGCVFGAGLGLLCYAIESRASEVPKQPQRDDCYYKPQRGDEVRQICDFDGETKSYKLRGNGYIKLWICGEPYTIEIECPPIEAK